MNSTAGSRCVLMVDDDVDFYEFFRMAFERADASVRLHHVIDGRRCLDFLHRREPFDDAPSPDIVVLDLDMPGMDGRETLKHLVADDSLRHLPVVILTSNDDHMEVMRMYRFRCSAYLNKPLGFSACVDMAQKFCDFWFSTALLPSRRRPSR